MTRWHHGHSILIGTLLGFLLSRELLWAVTIAFALGLLFGRGWASLTRLGHWLAWNLPRRRVTILPPRRPF